MVIVFQNIVYVDRDLSEKMVVGMFKSLSDLKINLIGQDDGREEIDEDCEGKNAVNSVACGGQGLLGEESFSSFVLLKREKGKY